MRREGESATSSELRYEPLVTAFVEKRTCSIQYVVADSDTKQCALIDPVLDFEPKSGATSTHSADALLRFIEQQGYTPVWILDTHPHADHFSAAGYLKDRTSPHGNRREGRRSPKALEGHLQSPRKLSH